MASRIAAEGGGIASLVLVVLLVSLSLAYVLLHRRLGRRAAALGRRLQGLETREGRMARAVKGAGLGLWEWDRQEGGLHWSDEFKAIAGLPRDQTPTWAHLESRLETSDRGALRTSLQAPTVECEFRLQTDEGPRWHLLVGRQDNDGRRASGILMDIHERRAVQAERERLLEAQALDLASAREDLMKAQMMNAVGSLAGGLAHDFNNYLQVIKGSATTSPRSMSQTKIWRRSWRRPARPSPSPISCSLCVTRRFTPPIERRISASSSAPPGPCWSGCCLQASTWRSERPRSSRAPPSATPASCDSWS